MAPNDILNYCLKSAVGRNCAFGESSKSESKQRILVPPHILVPLPVSAKS